ncbi:MAG: helix-turn-helix domain-containing protein [Clostridia bacterium]|jgi:excisionase family DNA binding protein|nr:helix-turn-helix domain-containing protein [Clostridia bacterium]
MAEEIRMLTINEAAELVPGLTKYRIREMCINGQIPCVKAGRKYLICEQVLYKTLMEGTPAAQEEPEIDSFPKLRKIKP